MLAEAGPARRVGAAVRRAPASREIDPTVRTTLPAPPMASCRPGASPERPDERDVEDGDRGEQRDEGKSDLPVVAEAVSARLQNHRVRRSGDRGEEGGRACHGEGHQEGPNREPEIACY